MTDGELTDDDDIARRLQAARGSVGLDESRRRLAEYEQTGAFITVEDALTHFDHELSMRLARG